jgi:hypothetical protein
VTLRIISYGGGVQSTALVVLAATGQLGHVDAAVWSNVGDDSEHPKTIDYVRDVATPWAAEHGLEVVTTQKTRRDGTPVTLLGEIRRKTSSIPIPVHMENGAPGRRTCTGEFKIKVISKWLRQHGATEQDPATVIVGISVDEIERLNNRRVGKLEVVEYPLVDRRLTRADCMQIISSAGLPVPVRSACYFCPYQSPSKRAEQRRDEPELFWKSVEIERLIVERCDTLGKPRFFMTRGGRPLDEAIVEAQQTLFDSDVSCDSGYCMT